AGRLFGEATVGIDGVGNRCVDALRGQITCVRRPYIEVLATVTWRSVDKACAGVVGYVIAREKWHPEFVAFVERFEGMLNFKARQIIGSNRSNLLKRGYARLTKNVDGQFIGQ